MMEIDECSAGGDSGAEEEEDEESMHGERTESSSSSSSNGSTSSESADESPDEHDTSGSESHSSDEDDGENDQSEETVQRECVDEVRWETCIAAGSKVKLPQDLCEHPSILHEMLDPSLWQEFLTDDQRQSLLQYLPEFPKDCDVAGEQEKTLNMLFQRDNQRFGVAPLDTFASHLSSGHYRPDIRRMRHLVRKAQQRRLLFDERKRTYELAEQLFKSRENLLINAYEQGFSSSTIQNNPTKMQWRKPQPSAIEERTQVRYIEELNALRGELGTARLIDTTSENEENYPQFQASSVKQKRKRKVQIGVQSSQLRANQFFEDEDIRPVFSTLQRADYSPNSSFLTRDLTEDSYRSMLMAHKKRRARGDIHPELNTQGISLADLTQRAQIGQKHKITGASVKVASSKKRIKLEPTLPTVPPKLPTVIKPEFDGDLEENFKNSAPELQIQNFPAVKPEPIDTYEIPTPKKKPSPPAPKIQKPLPPVILPPEVKKEVEEFMEPEEKQDFILPDENSRLEAEVDEDLAEKKDLDLATIDMLQIPIQLDDGMDILDDVKCENDPTITITEREVAMEEPEELEINGSGDLMQETHMCFFSLLRDAFMSKGEYRMSTAEVREAVTSWQSNPISPLNDWYSLSTSWANLVPAALGFLAGELVYPQELDQERDQEFVPYLENKGRGVYAWIGAGRDSDSRLTTLCTKFLLYKDSLGPPVIQTPPVTTAPVAVKSTSVQIITTNANGAAVQTASPVVESIPDSPALTCMMESEPPKALSPTDWKVRLSTPEEREEFRRQERLRYAAPHKAFTYRMHGYASVVGPVKGIYQHNSGAGLTKAREHSLLVADRPNFVTILALVRDATARLPNGEGTRADICMLLKDSQYIKDQSEQPGNDKDSYLNSVVSGALDRLHYEADPCVRYYPKRKEWLYLHRARSESEFEMYHQQLQGVVKTKKNSGGSSRNKSTQSSPKLVNGKEPSPAGIKETTPKKERKITVQTQAIIKKENKVEERSLVDQSLSTEVIAAPAMVSIPPPTISTPSVPVVTPSLPSPILATAPPPVIQPTIEPRETVIPVEVKPMATPVAPLKKVATNIGGKPVTVVKTSPAQSLLQSNQHFPHHQIQVSTSAGLQTIRLSGHSVLHSAQPVSSSGNTLTPTSVATIFPTAKIQGQTQQTVISNQAGKSILQTSNVKQSQGQASQPQTQHVLPGKTLLASQIKLVSSGQIKSLLTGHGLQGQTIFIKQSSPSTSHTPHIQHVQQIKQTTGQQHIPQQQQTISTPGMQRIIAQIGGKPIAVQIQQSPHQQQTQQQKILAKVLTGAGGGQLISVESLLAQKGLKLATTTTATGQVNRQGKQVIQTQYQVVSQAQASSVQSKLISTQQQHQQPTVASSGGQTVRMVTAQLAGKPIVLASGNKSVGVGISSSGSMVLGKQPGTQQNTGQQPIILPSQLLNIKTLHGLKVIPTPAGLKTGAAVYARVIAPTTIAAAANQQATNTQQPNVQSQTPRNSPFGAP